jgi:putative acetyltransferase
MMPGDPWVLLVRPERAGDEPAIAAVVGAAFRRDKVPGDEALGDEPVEVRLVDDLRAGEGWLPRLSLVAEVDGIVTGHVLCSRGWVGEAPVLGLGPLAVEPGDQRRGVGRALVQAVLAAADALDEPLVALLGSPVYYGRFGFVPADSLGIEAPEPACGAHFQVRPLAAYDPGLRGRFRYAAAFDGL